MLILGFDLPLWAVFLVGIIAIIIAWKFIKFALKILLVIVIFFVILIGLDILGVFSIIQNFISGII